MDSKQLNDRLIAIGEIIKGKGWNDSSIDIGISYLAMFDRPQGPRDPMISYRPYIAATVHHSEKNGDFEQETSRFSDGVMWDIKDLDAAIDALENIAEKMPRMAEESARIKAAKAKLSAEDRRLLGIR